MRDQDLVHFLFLSRVNIMKKNVAIGGQPDGKCKSLGNGPKGGSPLAFVGILDSTLFNPKRAKQFPVPLGMPTENIAHRVPVNFFRRFMRDLQSLDNLFPEPVDSAVVDQIFQARALTITSVTKVSLNTDH